MIMGVSGTYALVGENSGNSAFSTGAVDIELNEYTVNDKNEEVAYKGQYKNVTPNQELNLKQRITNKAANCYVRAKVTLKDASSKDVQLNLGGMPKGWEKIGEYYYYTSDLNTAEQVDIFEKITLPKDLPNSMQGTNLTLHIVAEAVQATNFEPNFESEDPWNGVKIAKTINNNYAVVGNEDGNKMIIKYEDNTNEYIKVPDDFLEKFNKMMPGDTRETELKIEGISNKKSAEFFVNIEAEAVTQEQLELLSKVTLIIKNSNGEEIFKGSLAEAKKINLGKYMKNETEKLTFIIQVPEDLSSKYAGINPSLIFTFSAKYEEDVISKIIERISNPQTGDLKFDLSLILFFTATVGLIVVLALSRTKEE